MFSEKQAMQVRRKNNLKLKILRGCH